MYAYLNDHFLDQEQLRLHVSDLAITRGYGVFDFLKTVNGKPVFLNEHLERFYASAKAMHLQPGISKQQLGQVIVELTRKNEISSSGIRITLTGGYSTDGYTITKPNLFITQQSITEIDEAAFNKGLRLLPFEYQRQLPEIKTLDYTMAVWLQPLLKEKGCDELLYHQNGWITESPRANFFAVTREGKIITPGQNILAGITRNKLISVFPEIEEGPLHLSSINDWTEAFIASTTKDVLPVTQIGDEIIGDRPGPVARMLLIKLKELVAG